jgi:hypothetical protein
VVAARGACAHLVNEITAKTISCPYCGEHIDILVDGSLPEQEYVEDCQVCCRPIMLSVMVGADDDAVVTVRCENE